MNSELSNQNTSARKNLTKTPKNSENIGSSQSTLASIGLKNISTDYEYI